MHMYTHMHVHLHMHMHLLEFLDLMTTELSSKASKANEKTPYVNHIPNTDILITAQQIHQARFNSLRCTTSRQHTAAWHRKQGVVVLHSPSYWSLLMMLRQLSGRQKLHQGEPRQAIFLRNAAKGSRTFPAPTWIWRMINPSSFTGGLIWATTQKVLISFALQ